MKNSINEKDMLMIEAMSKLKKTLPQKNLTSVVIHKANRKTKFTLAIMPQWSVNIPPYSLSRLSAVSRGAGFATTVFDFNIEAYHQILNKYNKNLWSNSGWRWTKDNFVKEIKPYFDNFQETCIDKIVKSQPDVIGFSLYSTNEYVTNLLVLKLKKLLPNCKFIVGGPQVSGMSDLSKKLYDFIVEGEGEHVLLEILEKIEKNEKINTRFFPKNFKVRLNLDSLPPPDYSDFDFSQYTIPNAVSSELSRGCIAKCVFCAETLFWKYRGRMTNSLLNEVENLYNSYNVNKFWFIDSLTNGNLKELQAFASGLIEKKIKIKWQGNARCDARMDLNYFKLLKKSGCYTLFFGVENGSQKVLDAMKKEITIDEVEQNLKDCFLVKINPLVNIMLGFPNEDKNDVDETFTLLWRIKNYKLSFLSVGVTYSYTPFDSVALNPEKYDISPTNFLNSWTTNNLSNTKLHRLIRQKSIVILLQLAKIKIHNFPYVKKSFKLKYDKKNEKQTIEREIFDYNIINSDLGDFQNSIMNEIWVLLRKLWISLGPYEIEIKFDPEYDYPEFGSILSCNYSALHKFSINETGDWNASFYYKFIQDDDAVGWGDKSFEYTYNGSGMW